MTAVMNPALVMTPEETLDQLKKTISNSRTMRTLETIFEVCSEHREHGETDFKYSTIARIGEKRGLPRVQSIHNKTGEPYRILIDSFRESLSGSRKPKVASKSADWIESIEDHKIKLLVKVQEAELKEAKKMLEEIKPLPRTITVNNYETNTLPTEAKLTPKEHESLERLLSDQFLKDNDFERGSRGDLYHNGRMIFEPGTFDAIEKACKYL